MSATVPSLWDSVILSHVDERKKRKEGRKGPWRNRDLLHTVSQDCDSFIQNVLRLRHKVRGIQKRVYSVILGPFPQKYLVTWYL